MSFTLRMLTVLLTLISTTQAFAAGIGNEMGLFCLQVQGFINTNRAVALDNPACYAMTSKKAIVMTVAIDEAINNQTYMNYIKKLTLEPYIYGIDRNQQPVLCGNIVRVEILKQQAVKFGTAQVAQAFGGLDPKFTAMIIWKQPAMVGPVNVWKVLDVQVNQGASYMARQEILQQFPTQGLNVICSTLPMTMQTQSAQPFQQQAYPQVQQPAYPQVQQPQQQYQVPQYQYQAPVQEPTQLQTQQQQQPPATQQRPQPIQKQPYQQQPYVQPTWTGPNY